MSQAPLRVFITGASSGLGRALVEQYLSAGAQVGALARRTDALSDLRANYPAQLDLYRADVRDTATVQSAAAQFLQRHDSVDVVIASAGVSCGTLTEYAEDLPVWQQTFDTNVIGVVKTFQPFLTGMKARHAGVLAAIASVAGVRGLPGAGAYSASKAAVINYMEALRVELRGSGVTALTVRPGYIRTPMTAVNPYRMPFLLDADDAARRIIRAVRARRTLLTVPWQMSIVCRILSVLPRPLFDRLFEHAPRKPRQLL